MGLSQKAECPGLWRWLVFMSWIISYTNKWEEYSNYIEDGVEISRNWATAHFGALMVSLGTVLAPVYVSFSIC